MASTFFSFPAATPGRSYGDRLNETHGFGPGFDTVRLLLCALVLVWHAWALQAGSSAPGKAGPAWMLFELLVPMFFALSGFLVAGSALRVSPASFLLNRATRILPTLVVMVSLTALVLGPALTTLPLADYVRHRDFTAYFLNAIGIARYPLPGVFATAPIGNAVNGSLWTLIWEILCYLLMATAIALGLVRHGRLLAAVAIGWLLAGVAHAMLMPIEAHGLVARLLKNGFFGQGGLLIPYFLGGAALYQLRHQVRHDHRLASLFLVGLGLASLLVDGTHWSKTPLVALLLWAPSVYLVTWAGLLPLPRPWGFRSGDYSFGIYVSHFPIQQALQCQFGFGHWGWLLLASVLPVTVIAALSWHLVERPLLLRRRQALAASNAFNVRFGGTLVSMRPPG